MSDQPPPPPTPPGSTPTPAGRPPPPQPPSAPTSPTGGIPPGSQLTWDVGDGVGRAWELFRQAPGAWVGAILALVAVSMLPIVVFAIAFSGDVAAGGDVASGGDVAVGGELGVAATVAMVVVSVVVVVASFVVAVGVYRASLAAVDGREVTFGTFFELHRLGAVLGTILLVALGTIVGLVLCILPGLVFAVMAMWAPLFVMDGHSPLEAITRSIALTRQRWADALVGVVMTQVIATVGMLACGIGLLIASPVSWLLTAWLYRHMVGMSDLAETAPAS